MQDEPTLAASLNGCKDGLGRYGSPACAGMAFCSPSARAAKLSPPSTCPYRKSNPDVMMVESAEKWNGLDAAACLHGAADRCIFAKGEMGSDLVVIVGV